MDKFKLSGALFIVFSILAIQSFYSNSSVAKSAPSSDCKGMLNTEYLTTSCKNTLFSGSVLNGTSSISDLSCATFGGWIVSCVFVVHNSNHSVVYSASSQTGGQNYNPAINMTSPVQDARKPAVGVFGDNVYVQYEAKNGVYNVFLANSTNGGETFGHAVKLSNSSVGVNQSSLIVDNTGKVVSTWVDGDDAVSDCSHC